LAQRRLTEEEILQLFRRELRLTKPHSLNITGNTDDAAIMPLLPSLFRMHSPLTKPKRSALSDGIVLTQDGLIEGVHFRLDYYSPAQVVAKCMAANLSDLAAMGARPLGGLVYVGLPRKYAHEEFVLSLAEGNLRRRCDRLPRLDHFGGSDWQDSMRACLKAKRRAPRRHALPIRPSRTCISWTKAVRETPPTKGKLSVEEISGSYGASA
jgi:hypothetical protein